MNVMRSYFAYPEVFWVLPLLVLVGLAAAWSWRQKRRALRYLGQTGAVHKLLRTEPRSRRLRAFCLALGLLLLLVGTAGPKWGWDLPRDTAGGHDIVIVLDASRSMLAEQPSRLKRSLRALYDLADQLQKRGGPRLALVVFAAQPHLVFPLTWDYDHFRVALSEIDAGDLPASIYVDEKSAPISGTRIGAALTLAMAAFDEEARAPRAILLLSDGDDPEASEKEWLKGVQAARNARVPIFTVGVGDPTKENVIIVPQIRNFSPDKLMNTIEDGPLQFEGKDVNTKLEEAVLRDIAERTNGIYLPARTSKFPLGTLLPEALAKQIADQPEGRTGSVPVEQPRQAWFLWPALVLLGATLLFRERRGGIGRQGNRSGRRSATKEAKTPSVALAGVFSRAVLLILVVAALFLLGADGPDDDWVRQGNAAFAQGELEKALSFYERAEATTTDPGLIAFNKAAVFYRLKRYREAELHYFRCLEDTQAPATRQAQAFFGLGTALLRQAEDKNVELLDRAIDAFSTCLTQRNLDSQLVTDAQYNLEMARWLRFQAAPQVDPAKDEPDQQPQQKPRDPKRTNKGGSDDPSGSSRDDPDNPDPGNKGDDPKLKPTPASKMTPSGNLKSLPDKDAPLNLAPEDTARYLEDLYRRISQQHRQNIHSRPMAARPFKDW